jgi:hypothetical protein
VILLLVNSSILRDVTPCSPVNGLSTFRKNMSPSSSLRSKSPSLAVCFMLVSCLTCSSTLKMETLRSVETSFNFLRNTRRYISEYSYFPINLDKNYKRFSVSVIWTICSVFFRTHDSTASSTPSSFTRKNTYYCSVQFLTNSLLAWPRKRPVWGDGCVALLPTRRPTGCMPK